MPPPRHLGPAQHGQHSGPCCAVGPRPPGPTQPCHCPRAPWPSTAPLAVPAWSTQSTGRAWKYPCWARRASLHPQLGLQKLIQRTETRPLCIVTENYAGPNICTLEQPKSCPLEAKPRLISPIITPRSRYDSIDLFLDKRACSLSFSRPSLFICSSFNSSNVFFPNDFPLLSTYLPVTTDSPSPSLAFLLHQLGALLNKHCRFLLHVFSQLQVKVETNYQKRSHLQNKSLFSLSHPFFLMPFAGWKHRKEEEENSKLQSISLLSTFSP